MKDCGDEDRRKKRPVDNDYGDSSCYQHLTPLSGITQGLNWRGRSCLVVPLDCQKSNYFCASEDISKAGRAIW